MKIKTARLIIATLVVAGSAMLGLAGCAGLGSSNTESLLSAAGFRAATPQTPQQKEIYATLPAYKVHRATVNGKTFYVFKDAKNGVVYVGHEPEYQRYQQLAIQQNIAQENYMAAVMDQDVAVRWYGVWGANPVWW
jgi:alkylated DNA repair dioxygenase AlkB